MAAQFTIPLVEVIPGQLIASSLWNNEWNNLAANFIPAGMDSYSDTDTQMQIQTNPYPGSVTSHATNFGGETERIRYQISQIIGQTYWYQQPGISLATVQNVVVPLGATVDYPSATPPNSNYLLANGQAIGRVAYAALFTLIGTTFGAGDASTTFNLPNYTDRLSITAGNLYAVAATGGAVSHTLTNAEVPNNSYSVTDPGHIHTITDPGHSHGVTDPGHGHKLTINTGSVTSNQQTVTTSTVTTANPSATNLATSSSTGLTVNSASSGITGANSHATNISVSDSNGGGSHNILNPYIAMYKMIRVL